MPELRESRHPRHRLARGGGRRVHSPAPRVRPLRRALHDLRAERIGPHPGPETGWDPFDRRKLSSAIEKAASTSLSPQKLAALIDDVEATLKQSGTSEVASQRIGEMVLERLADVDPMSYIRFRIVYAKLDDLTALRDELAALDRRREVSRDRKVAEQITLPIEALPVASGGRKRKR